MNPTSSSRLNPWVGGSHSWPRCECRAGRLTSVQALTEPITRYFSERNQSLRLYRWNAIGKELHEGLAAPELRTSVHGAVGLGGTPVESPPRVLENPTAAHLGDGGVAF